MLGDRSGGVLVGFVNGMRVTAEAFEIAGRELDRGRDGRGGSATWAVNSVRLLLAVLEGVLFLEDMAVRLIVRGLWIGGSEGCEPVPVKAEGMAMPRDDDGCRWVELLPGFTRRILTSSELFRRGRKTRS